VPVLERLATRAYVQGDAPLPDAPTQQAVDLFLESASHALRTSPDRETVDAALWVRIVESLRAYARMVWLVDPDDLSPRVDDAEIREAGMAHVAEWLFTDRYRGRRIIVWAATAHTARNLRGLRTGREHMQLLYDSVPSLGERLWTVLGEDLYSLGLTAYEGTSGLAGGPEWNIGQASSGSLEDLMEQTGLQAAFLDLRVPRPGSAWLSTPLRARPLGYAEAETVWPTVLDGLLFIRTMTPSTGERSGASR
jgi:erythromycin esterase